MGKSNKFLLTTKSHSSTRVNPYDKITLNALNVSCPDKQVILPKLESNGAQLIFIELYSLFIFIIALGTQYLNIHRSFWWLSSKARSQQPLNHNHLIDSDVSQFSLIFIGQSSIITILRALMNKTTILNRFTNIRAQQYYYKKLLSKPSSEATTSKLIDVPITNNSPLTTLSANDGISSNGSYKQQNGNNHHSNNQCQQQPPQSLPNGNSPTTQTSSHSSSSLTPSLSTQQQYQSTTTLSTVVISTTSWICSYYLAKCAYRIWANFGLNGLSFVSYPIVSII